VAITQPITRVSGLPTVIRAPIALPAKLPTPAPAAIRPSSASWVNPAPWCWWRTANAANIIRKPVSTRIVALPTSAGDHVSTHGLPARLVRVRGTATPAPRPRSTRPTAGCASPAPHRQGRSARLNQSAPGESKMFANSAATMPAAVPAARPNTVSRALVLASVMSRRHHPRRHRRLEHGERLGEHHLAQRAGVDQPGVEVGGHQQAHQR